MREVLLRLLVVYYKLAVYYSLSSMGIHNLVPPTAVLNLKEYFTSPLRANVTMSSSIDLKRFAHKLIATMV